jgi:hypothetical protein
MRRLASMALVERYRRERFAAQARTVLARAQSALLLHIAAHGCHLLKMSRRVGT